MTMKRSTKRFITLISLLRLWDNETTDYYLNCIDNDDYSLVTESLLLEMECSLYDVTNEIHSCSLK